MRSAAYGLTALSPSIGAAEDFIDKKGIPPEQVPAFLAKLGDPQLAGLIAQKQRLKQAEAAQAPAGSPRPGPPTVKDEINQKLAQILQGQQQQQQPQQPQQLGMPPQVGQPQMAAGLGGLDAGAMEAPQHFNNGGGIVAFTAGGTTPKSKEQTEQEKPNPYNDIYNLGEDYIKQLKGSTALHQIAGTEEDPAVKLQQDLIKQQRAEGRGDYAKESGYDAEMARWMRGLSGAFRGETLGQTLTAGYDKAVEKREAAKTKYDALKDRLDAQNLALVKAMTVAKDSNSKADYDHANTIRDSIHNTMSAMANTKLDEVKWDANRSDHATDVALKKEELGIQRSQLNKPTNEKDYVNDYVKAMKDKKDPRTESELAAEGHERYISLVAGIKNESADVVAYESAKNKIETTLGKTLSRAKMMAGNNANDPAVMEAQRKYDAAMSELKALHPTASTRIDVTGTSSTPGTPTVTNW
jgi:hypothetical protein